MQTIPKIIKDTPTCKQLNNDGHIRCAIRGLYSQVNANYDFLQNGGLEEAIEEEINDKLSENIKETVREVVTEIITIDGSEATQEDIDSLFP